MSLEVRVMHHQSIEFSQLKEWRDRYIGVNPANEPDYYYWEGLRDDYSYNFAFYMENVLVGGVRLTPVGHGITMGERLLKLERFLEQPHRVLEVNRLIIDEKMRGQGLMRKALIHCFRWARDNTAHKALIALCAPRLVPLYKRVGASEVATDIVCDTVEDKKYSLINLNLKELHD